MSMAREGRAGKGYRRDWPSFLNQVVTEQVWQAFAAGQTPKGRADQRWTAKLVVLTWVMMGWLRSPILGERFAESWNVLARLYWRRRRAGRTYAGLVKASRRLGEQVLHHFWSGLRSTFSERLKEGWHWYGWVVMTVDGSRLNAPRTRANERRLGRAGREKTGPQWWITQILHLPSGLLWDWRSGPGCSDERRHLQAMLPDLPASALLVADIGFCRFALLWRLLLNGVDFLIRVGGNSTLLATLGRSTLERRDHGERVYLYPVQSEGYPPLLLRVIVLKRRGRRVYLLTNVLNPQRLSRSMAAELYSARWGVEVSYRHLKETLERRKILARQPEVGAWELAGNVMALGLLMLQAACALGSKMFRVSVRGVLRLLRKTMERLRYGASTRAFVERIRLALRDTYRRTRCKRSRDWPHKKHDPPPGVPRLRRPRSKENAMIQLFEPCWDTG